MLTEIDAYDAADVVDTVMLSGPGVLGRGVDGRHGPGVTTGTRCRELQFRIHP